MSRQEPVNRNTGSHYRSPAGFRTAHDARRVQLQREAALPLGAALISIVLMSLGLWWAILWAVSPLVSALLD
jgi:hypothetical protein